MDEPDRFALVGTRVDPGSGQMSYTLTQPLPTRDPITHEFSFDGCDPNFRPNLSPAEILHGGAFGGAYFRPWYSKKLRMQLTDDWHDLPSGSALPA